MGILANASLGADGGKVGGDGGGGPVGEVAVIVAVTVVVFRSGAMACIHPK